jgi:acetyltransferase-like isoleucine patch superfamily enzyme
MTSFFTDAFHNMSPAEAEVFYRTVFLSMDSPYAAEIRRQYYAAVLRRMGEHVRIGCGVKIVNPQFVTLGDDVSLDDHCTLVARSERGITLGEGAQLKYGVYLDTEGKDGYIEIGNRVYIGTGCCLHGHQGLIIGDDTLFAQHITITPYSHIFEDPARLIIQQGGHSRKMTIGKDCYLGKNVCVLYSADIEDGAVVGAGSVVVHTVPAYSVAVGNPARVIRKRGEAKPR